MTTRTARCGCGRVQVTVEGEPFRIAICQCDFCQKRTGSVLPVQAYFTEDQLVEIRGETTVYNGLEADGASSETGHEINYNFCTTCGSTLYWTLEGNQGATFAIAVGNFVDPEFPPPTTEFYGKLHHRWVPQLPVAERFEKFRTS